MKVAIVGDYASQSYFLGRELEKLGYKVEYFLQYNEFSKLPDKFHYLGAVRGKPIVINYFYKAFWMTLGKLLKKADIQIVNGTYWKCVRSANTCYYYHGSDLRMKVVKPQTPSFVSLRELLDYSPDSVFLPRAVDSTVFRPLDEIKEQRNAHKDAEGIDFIIGHYAHSPSVKNSHLFQQAIEEIQKEEKIKIEYRVKLVPHNKIVEELNYCDFVLDHVNPATGKTYNVISIESLLCGTRVGTYYDKNYIDFLEIESNLNYIDPSAVKNSILRMLSNKKTIDRNIIVKYHDPKNVIKRVLKYWEEWGFL